MQALTKIDLDIIFSGGCAHPKCKDPFCGEEMYINQICHPESPTCTKYNRKTGLLTVECAQCDKPIVVIQVASP